MWKVFLCLSFLQPQSWGWSSDDCYHCHTALKLHSLKLFAIQSCCIEITGLHLIILIYAQCNKAFARAFVVEIARGTRVSISYLSQSSGQSRCPWATWIRGRQKPQRSFWVPPILIQHAKAGYFAMKVISIGFQSVRNLTVLELCHLG